MLWSRLRRYSTGQGREGCRRRAACRLLRTREIPQPGHIAHGAGHGLLGGRRPRGGDSLLNLLEGERVWKALRQGRLGEVGERVRPAGASRGGHRAHRSHGDAGYTAGAQLSRLVRCGTKCGWAGDPGVGLHGGICRGGAAEPTGRVEGGHGSGWLLGDAGRESRGKGGSRDLWHPLRGRKGTRGGLPTRKALHLISLLFRLGLICCHQYMSPAPKGEWDRNWGRAGKQAMEAK